MVPTEHFPFWIPVLDPKKEKEIHNPIDQAIKRAKERMTTEPQTPPAASAAPAPVAVNSACQKGFFFGFDTLIAAANKYLPKERSLKTTTGRSKAMGTILERINELLATSPGNPNSALDPNQLKESDFGSAVQQLTWLLNALHVESKWVQGEFLNDPREVLRFLSDQYAKNPIYFQDLIDATTELSFHMDHRFICVQYDPDREAMIGAPYAVGTCWQVKVETRERNHVPRLGYIRKDEPFKAYPIDDTNSLQGLLGLPAAAAPYVMFLDDAKKHAAATKREMRMQKIVDIKVKDFKKTKLAAEEAAEKARKETEALAVAKRAAEEAAEKARKDAEALAARTLYDFVVEELQQTEFGKHVLGAAATVKRITDVVVPDPVRQVAGRLKRIFTDTVQTTKRVKN